MSMSIYGFSGTAIIQPKISTPLSNVARLIQIIAASILHVM